MKGYAFLDADGRLQYRDGEYIEKSNPFFWQQNKYDILERWKFDTEDMTSMLFMFRQIRDLKLNRREVIEFCTLIGFDMQLLKDANKIQPE